MDPVALLSHLVSFRTDVSGNERALAAHLAELLERHRPDEVVVAEAPRAQDERTPSSYVYARFGEPKLLVNAHLDTVPPNAEWSSDPFKARIAGGRLYALGAADTKGAAAAILCALETARPRDTAILFSGDEEFSSVAMRSFLAGKHRPGIERAIVCEPTNLRPGVRHRGFTAFEVALTGPGGHSSKADDLPAPIATLARLAVRLDDWAKAHKGKGPPGFPGMCVNLAKLDGGVAFNVVPAEAKLVVSLRPPPGADTAAIYAEVDAIIAEAAPGASTKYLRKNAPFATKDFAGFAKALAGGASGGPIDLGFWTEAALLSENGIDAVVLGPGSIAQAHAPDEWIELEELTRARAFFEAAFAQS